MNITQKDIRQVQLANGGDRSGIEILLENNGLDPSMLDEVMIAGQFGSHLPQEDLTGVGILPEEVRERIHYVGKYRPHRCRGGPSFRRCSERDGGISQRNRVYGIGRNSGI